MPPTARHWASPGTPTFFLNGKKLVLNTEAEFRQLLSDAAE